MSRQATIGRIALVRTAVVRTVTDEDDPTAIGRPGPGFGLPRQMAITMPAIGDEDTRDGSVRASEIRALLASALSSMEVSNILDSAALFDDATIDVADADIEDIVDEEEAEEISGVIDVSDAVLDALEEEEEEEEVAKISVQRLEPANDHVHVLEPQEEALSALVGVYEQRACARPVSASVASVASVSTPPPIVVKSEPEKPKELVAKKEPKKPSVPAASKKASAKAVPTAAASKKAIAKATPASSQTLVMARVTASLIERLGVRGCVSVLVMWSIFCSVMTVLATR